MNNTPEPIEARVLPHSLEAERSILGAILLHGACFTDAAEHVAAADFYRAAHRTIFEHFARLATANVELDFITVKDSLIKAGKLEEVGGAAYIASLTDGMPRASAVAHYAQIVRERARLRRIIETANRLLSEAYDAGDDPTAVIDRAEQALFALGEGAQTGGFTRLSDILPAVMEQIEGWCRTPGGVSGVPSGFLDLDYLTRGFQPGNLIILGARPSMGKSAMALNIARHVAGLGQTVGAFSLEMSELELAIRALVHEARVDGHRLQMGRVRQSEWARLSMAVGTLSELPLFIDPSPAVSIFEIRSRARRLKAAHGLGLLIIDYAQLMGSQSDRAAKQENRTTELAAITRALKRLAKDLDVPLIALSQLSRRVEERTDKRPMLSDLRESGSFEQDADLVLFIHRPEVYEDAPPEEHIGLAELIIAKQRNGPIGTVELVWLKEEMRFANRAADAMEQEQPLPEFGR